jgi:dihydroorotate dehydrogenase
LPLGNLKLYLYGILVVIGILFVGYVEYKIYNAGYSASETKRIKEISEINSKSAELLKQQKDEHDRFVEKQDKLLNNLRANNEKLNEIVRENEEQASKEPDAKQPAIGKSSVMRLNRIR